jgi:hypothetical protein
MNIAMNAFAQRHTPESRFSHFDGSERDLLYLVDRNFKDAKPGYRDGVVLVQIPCPDGFYSGVVEVGIETRLEAKLVSRQKDEESYIEVTAHGSPKLPARHVEVVLYRRDLLMETNSATTDAEYEVVSINARATKEPEPMTPVAMARSFLGLAGGTKATYTAEQFADAIVYWSRRAMCGGEG